MSYNGKFDCTLITDFCLDVRTQIVKITDEINVGWYKHDQDVPQLIVDFSGFVSKTLFPKVTILD